MPRLFMNLLRRFYFMRAAARGTKTKNGWVFEELLENGGETAKYIDEKG